MGCYAYCIHCREGMPEPTIEEVVKRVHVCPHCRGGNACNKTVQDVLEEFQLRLATLEDFYKGKRKL